ncbi:hypothetical protein T484DRAFT_1825600 [Baffinella frigidus]|nr:hypothetical protein T484DRAFT_1825600 [Cryptophyta sp. CCMP2293]
MIAGGALVACGLALLVMWSSGTSSKKGTAAARAPHPPSGAELALSQALPNIEFPYPVQVSLTSLVICNYDAKDWWFFPEKGVTGGPHRLVPVVIGKGCVSLPLAEACTDKACWRRGHLSPCKTGVCTSRQVTAGVNIVSDGSVGGASCKVCV